MMPAFRLNFEVTTSRTASRRSESLATTRTSYLMLDRSKLSAVMKTGFSISSRVTKSSCLDGEAVAVRAVIGTPGKRWRMSESSRYLRPGDKNVELVRLEGKK